MTESQKTNEAHHETHEHEKTHEKEHEKEHQHEDEKSKKEVSFEINLKFFANHWTSFAVIAIMLLAFYLRIFSFNYPYLLNVDSYFHYRYMNFIVKDGSIPAIDPYMLAPDGRETGFVTFTANLYHYAGAYSYLFIRMFFPGLELWQFLVYFPAFLASLMAIPAYLIGKTIYDRKAGVLMALLVVFNPNIFMRTLGGDPDNDAFVLLMTLVVVAFFLISISSLKKNNSLKNRSALFYSAITGITMGAFALSWIGYWYILYLMIGFVFVKIAIDILLELGKKHPKDIIKSNIPLLASLAIIIAVFFVVSIPFIGTGFVKTTIEMPFQATELKAESGDFPNVFVSVQEMMAGGSVKEIIQRSGSVFFLLTFVLCIPYLIGAYIKKKTHIDTMILILLWSLGALMATIVAIRFSIILAIPISLGSAIILAKIWRIAIGEDKGIFE